MHSFKDVQVPTENSYVKPGFWKMAPTKAELVTTGKTPYLSITFEGGKGKLTDKFYLTEKAISRLQYLHVGLYDKRLEKEFSSDQDLATYFNTLFEKKSVSLNLVVGGDEGTNGKVYASLPFTGFIMSDDNFEEGGFEVGSTRYNDVVKRSTAPVSNSAIVGTTKEDEKLPWE